MDRRAAFITAATAAACILSAGLAVVANSGLLSLDKDGSSVGSLLPSDIQVQSLQELSGSSSGTGSTTTGMLAPNLISASSSPSTAASTTAPVETIVRYEDVYVTAGQSPDAAVPVTAPVSVTASKTTTRRVTARTTRPARPAVKRSTDDESGTNHESNDGDGDDD